MTHGEAPWWGGPAVLAAIAAGGVVGALARWGVGLVFPPGPGAWPWATLLVNVSGCVSMGLLMGTITRVGPGHRLLRPFLGVGVLGGYTTFSTNAVDAVGLVAAGRAGLALLYLALTAVSAVLAVLLGERSAGWVLLRTAGTTDSADGGAT